VNFSSTRGGAAVSLDEALLRGIAADGGLFVPDTLPGFSPEDFLPASSLAETAVTLLKPFFAESRLAADLPEIVAETLHFPIPCVDLDSDAGQLRLLELHHGPTAAFKDVGAGFLAACLSRLSAADEPRPLTILVATSGDTGGAVAAAFDGRAGIQVVVLFPAGRVSERQAKQLTCWGDNVLSLEVEGSFDDCQAMVKGAFADAALAQRFRFSSANSINIGRLLPQSTYYAHAALQHLRTTGRHANFIIPTGNLGNALACILARDMGLPVGDVILATNANRTIPDYLEGANWAPGASVKTLATAMDVGDPSNMERLKFLHGESEELQNVIRATSVNDEQIATQIKTQHRARGIALCPHTATAFEVYEKLSPEQRAADWILVATAHPAKFESVVEPLIGETVEIPRSLAAILDRPSRALRVQPNLDALAAALDTGFNTTV